jgi:hypothetical protein
LLIAVQITLGALTVLSQKHYIINSLHVVTGASVLATSLVLTLRSYRARFGIDAGPAHQGALAGSNQVDPLAASKKQDPAYRYGPARGRA